ncbi:hypothetical protein ACROYT_G037192 [Oculina patagonica]
MVVAAITIIIANRNTIVLAGSRLSFCHFSFPLAVYYPFTTALSATAGARSMVVAAITVIIAGRNTIVLAGSWNSFCHFSFPLAVYYPLTTAFSATAGARSMVVAAITVIIAASLLPYTTHSQQLFPPLQVPDRWL